MRHALQRLLLVVYLLCLPGLLQASTPLPLPELSAPVTDLTGTLSAEEKAALSQRLATLEAQQGAQIAILLLPTTQPESIEQFSIRLAEAWKIGRVKIDDGVIIIVAKDDRRMRIEVGYGLEGAIPDAIAKRIIEETMVPRFREGDFAGGLRSTVENLAKRIAGEALPPPAKAAQGSSGFDHEGLLILAALLASIARAAFGLIGALTIAGLAGLVIGWLTASASTGLIITVLIFCASFMRSGRGGRWGGGRGGGGGFSGGGGRFGGGGASGRW